MFAAALVAAGGGLLRVAVEFAYARLPFGGFGWTRIAYAAVDTPLAGFLPIIGVAGCPSWSPSSVVASPGRPFAGSTAATPRRVLSAALVAVALVAAGGGLRPFQVGAARDRSQRPVGIVQGNIPGRGIEAMGRARSVTNNHLSETST